MNSPPTFNSLLIHQELSKGGSWLSAARTWLQSNVKDGDTLCWSSNDLVKIPFCKFESLALTVAVAATIAVTPANPNSPGVNAAIALVRKRQQDYIDLYGSTDPETGSVEFGSGSIGLTRSEYVEELEEIITALEALLK